MVVRIVPAQEQTARRDHTRFLSSHYHRTELEQDDGINRLTTIDEHGNGSPSVMDKEA